MATNNAKKTTTDNTVISYEDLQKENENLKENVNQLSEKINLLMEQMLKLNQTTSSASVVKDSNRDIEVYSMVNGKLILSTTNRSDGKIYIFNGQFESQPIPFIDLKEICRSMKRYAQSGKFFINDEEAVRELGLISSYREVLSKAQLENIFNLNASEFITEYNNANKAQKAIIEGMVANKCLMDEEIDANILKALTKATGRDYMSIEPLPEEYFNKEG